MIARKMYLILMGLGVFFSVPTTASAMETFTGTPRVADGDTLVFDDARVRLLCLDAVELFQTCRSPVGDVIECGQKAKQALIEIIGPSPVTCQGDYRDKYNRPLVHCRARSINLSAQMVDHGWALSTCSETDEAERQAKLAKRGLWAWQFDAPNQWRKKHPRQ